MRRHTFLLFLVFLAFILAVIPANVAQTTQVGLLQVFDVQPSPVGKLALNQDVTFYFNRRVDCAEAGAALTWTPAIPAELSCDEYTATFTPSSPFQPDAAYTFELLPPLLAKDGAPLIDPFRATFTTAGDLTVAETLPSADAASVPIDSAITVVFDRPVVPLLMSSDMDELPHPLELAPAAAGSGEWVNTAVYVFTPAEPLGSATDYTVSVRAGLEAVDGSTIASAFYWSFRTEAPSVTSIYPRPTADDLLLNPTIQLRFNHAMDRSALESAFSFRAALARDTPEIGGRFVWADDGKGFAFTLNERLEPETSYKAGFPSALPLGRSSYTWTYKTVPMPAIEWTSPADGKTDVSSGGFSLHFASDMKIETLQERIRIEPAPDNLTRVYYSDWNDRYDIHFEAQPSTEYTIRIEPGMEDIYGNAISDPLIFSFTTSPLPPRLGMRVPGPVGFYNAYRQPTQLYITHRGVEKVNLALYRVPTNEFVSQLSSVPYWDDARIGDPQGAALQRRWTIDANTEENTTRYELLRLGENGPLSEGESGGLAPGVYFLNVSAPELDEWSREKTHYLNVSTAVLTVKHTSDRITVWAVDVDSGAPITGETINVYNQLGEYAGDTITDERGIAQLHVWYKPEVFTGLVAVLDSAEHFGIGYSIWSNGMEPRDFGIPRAYERSEYQTYLYTDRPVYRTAQPVYFRGIVRSKDDVVYMPAPFETVQATIHDARGRVVEKRVLEVSDFGSFNGKFEIASDASLGYHSISIALPFEGEYRWEVDRINFQVAEYRLPEYLVTLDSQRPEIVQGETATFELTGKYFFGGPVSKADVEYTVYPVPYRFNYTGDGYYNFSHQIDYGGRYNRGDYDSVIAEGALKTDANGVAEFDLAGDLQDDSRSQRWRVEAAIRDEAGQAIYDRSDLVVHRGLLYVGARAANHVGRAGEDSVINIIAVDWDSRPIANQDVNVHVLERRWTRTQEQDLTTGRTATIWNVEEIPLTSGSVITDAAGKARFVYQPPKGGVFIISVDTRDKLGNAVTASARSWVSSSSFVPWRQESDRTIELVPARQQYRIGETAQVLIASPFQGAVQALITIERGDVLSTELVTLTSNSHIHEFEILPQHAPNIFVSVFLIKAVDGDNPVAAWRMGLTELQVDTERKALNIEIDAVPDRAKPQDEVAFKLRVTDYKGDPVVAEVGVAVTDLASLSLDERNSARLLETFFGRQDLTVFTANSLVNNADEVTADVVEVMGTLDAMQDMYDCCFGGGSGGGGAPIMPALAPRSEFIDTPYWNASVVTDAAGEAVIDLRLPDNLTTWRLDARAITEARDGRFLVGEETFDLLSTRPLLIRPLTPRFFIVGDQAQLAAVVNNNTGRDISARVSIENLAGLKAVDDATLVQRVTIPAGGRQRVTWLVHVADVDSVAPYFVAHSDDNAFSDASISPVSADADGNLPVYRYDVPETVGAAGTLREGGTRVEALLLPRDFDVIAGKLDIRIDKSLAGVTAESLGYLEAETRRYVECTTTIVSRFLPNIVSYRALKELGLAQAELKDKLDALVSEGLKELYARQLSNGGWSWCAYPKSHAQTTAYALIGLAQAIRQGYPVDESVLHRAQSYLQRQMITPSLALERWQLNRQAFVLYALAYAGAPDVARSTTLFKSRERLNLDSIAFLAKTLQIINSADRQRLDALTQMMLNRAVTRATGAFFKEAFLDRWNWSSDIRSTALVLNALVKIRPESELLPNIVRHLVSVRKGRGHWSSRQENTWSIIALTNWMLASNELNPDYAYSVAVNDEQLLRDVAMSENVLLPDEISIDVAQLIQRETNLIEFERDDGDGVLYYTAHVDLDLPVHTVKSYGRGIEISRSYTLLGDEAERAVNGAAIGDLVQVRLRIVAPNTLRYVVIEDFFPAGAEAINPDLAISPQLGTMPGGDRIIPGAAGWGWWYFDHIEFRDEKAVIYASFLRPGVYEYVYTIRPVIAGNYNVIPPTAQELYFPEVYGRGDGALFTISE